MTRRLGGAATLMLALLMSNAAGAEPRNTAAGSAFAWHRGHYQYPNPCIVWDGYQWLNMCWRSRAFAFPAWAHFHR